MTFIWCWDDGEQHAQNVHVCEKCGEVMIERVWESEGLTWVDRNGGAINMETP
jgi:ribosomal protein L37AE/L43A